MGHLPGSSSRRHRYHLPAKEQGWQPEHASYELDWDSTIGPKDELVVIDKAWVEAREVNEPSDWDPVGQLVKYLETLFEASESVGYVTESWLKDDKYLPTKGLCDRTAGELIQALNQCKGDIGSMGDCKPAGAWIRLIRSMVSKMRMSLNSVTPWLRATAWILTSRTQSFVSWSCLSHASFIPVRSRLRHRKDRRKDDEYRKRVDYLYTVLKKNGMNVDTQNKNPSRLSRMPGIAGRKSFYF